MRDSKSARSRRLKVAFLFVIAGLAFYGWWRWEASPKLRLVWETELVNAYVSAPRFALLNRDGTHEVLVGSGKESVHGQLVMLDGESGNQLWEHTFSDEILYGFALLDVNGDSIRDIAVGGRRRVEDFFLLDGRTGETLWTLTGANPDLEIPPINFMSSQLVGDLDSDGLRDLLVIQTGGRDDLRIAGHFFFLRSADGALLHQGVAPDNMECYAIPVYERTAAGDEYLYVGTGGETLPGHLMKLRCPSLEEVWSVGSFPGNEAAEKLTDPAADKIRLKEKGFVASPLLTDLDGDGQRELIAAAMDGGVYRVDAETGRIAWRFQAGNTVANYSSPSAGRFNDDEILDIVLFVSHGQFPEYAADTLVWIDGESGELIHRREFAPFQYKAATPLVLEVNGDRYDEVFVNLNSATHPFDPEARHELVLLDGGPDKRVLVSREIAGFSMSTPSIVDLDGDETLDVFHLGGGRIYRFELRLNSPWWKPSSSPIVRWGEFRGTNATGIMTYERSSGLK